MLAFTNTSVLVKSLIVYEFTLLPDPCKTSSVFYFLYKLSFISPVECKHGT